MQVIHHPKAQTELIEAAQYYEGRVAGLGAGFLDEADFTVTRIIESPGRNPLIYKTVRRILMRRFPFAIHYTVNASGIRILAFKHHRRHPDYWRDRLSPTSEPGSPTDLT